MVRKYAESLTVFPDHLAGFTRADVRYGALT
jgi:hypothetical protein